MNKDQIFLAVTITFKPKDAISYGTLSIFAPRIDMLKFSNLELIGI